MGDSGTNKARVIQFIQRTTIPNQIASMKRSPLSIKGEKLQTFKTNKPAERQTTSKIDQIIKKEIIEEIIAIFSLKRYWYFSF
jgi:hypothetical protein